MMLSAEAFEAKALEMDAKADECFSSETADIYRALADQWRGLRVEAASQGAFAGNPSGKRLAGSR
jgi:hypothetical protein